MPKYYFKTNNNVKNTINVKYFIANCELLLYIVAS